MNFTINHRNKKNNVAFIEALSEELYTQYVQKLESAVRDIETVECTFSYGEPNWDKSTYFSCILYDKSKKSTNTDIKWSVFMAMADCSVKKYRTEMEKHRITIRIIGDPQKKPKMEHAVDEKKEKSQDDEVRLNVEPVTPRYSLSQLILPAEIAAELNSVITLIKKRDLIYNEWGFSEIDPVARSVVNFYGPPGTGKTMAAHAIVKELGMPFLPLNYSDIESKFVGDAPKNLVAAFKKAKETGAVLFFDEADSFLGKRITNVASSSDQAINSLRSQMLILLETYDVITIFATNLKENYDSAFESRILKHIQFRLPDKDLRIEIIKKHIPSKAPFDKEQAGEEFWNTLGDLSEELAPRELKNLVLNTLIKAATSEVQKLTPELFTAVFTEDKNKRDEIKRKKEERRKNLSADIKQNIETKNYNVVKETDQQKTQEEEQK